MAIFTGGLLQFIAGMWEFPRGNIFGATGKFPKNIFLSFLFKFGTLTRFVAFSAYGTFWMSYAAIFIPGTGVLAAYDNNTQELSNALGLYLVVWFMFTVMLMYVS